MLVRMWSQARRGAKGLGPLAAAASGLMAALAPAQAQQSAILEAIRDGAVSGASKIIVPTPPQTEDAAAEDAAAEDAAEGDAAAQVNAAPPIGGGTVLPSGPGGGIVGDVIAQQESDIVDRAFPLLASKWPFNRVYVCWEDPSPEFIEERTLVREAVLETWDAVSGLEFLGWAPCPEEGSDIRIAVRDSGPHVKGLGKFMAGTPEGMVLNFTFERWSPSCRETLEYCIRVIAVHEFGHAIGFAHEQNRPDTEGECKFLQQGTDGDTVALTPWDPHSVMNYCNPAYSNDGVLSEFDIVAVQYIYGMP